MARIAARSFRKEKRERHDFASAQVVVSQFDASVELIVRVRDIPVSQLRLDQAEARALIAALQVQLANVKNAYADRLNDIVVAEA